MIKKHIPNFITSLNLFSGAMAVYFAFQANYELVLILGFTGGCVRFSRWLCCALAESVFAYGQRARLTGRCHQFWNGDPVLWRFSLLRASELPEWAAFAGFIIPVFSALRLAKFNIDERQTTSFIGMPTPANAIFWIGLGFSYHETLAQQPYFVLGFIALMSLLLVSELPMFSLKFKNLKWKDNSWQFVFLAVCCCLLIFLKLDAFAPIIGCYIIISIIKRFVG